ncbi:MAG: Ig-like domain-containing protein, partial [Betaproteobacteria bacterium]|nr:Ig-like domain-containing protein [Betaproteobacteria bacterium]
MTEKKKPFSAIEKLKSLKRGAQALLSKRIDLDKVAKGLAITSIVVTEVEAAQKHALDKGLPETGQSHGLSETAKAQTKPTLKGKLAKKLLQKKTEKSDLADNTAPNKPVPPDNTQSDAQATSGDTATPNGDIGQAARLSLRAMLQDELASTQQIAKAYPITPDAARLAMRNMIDDEVNFNVARATTPDSNTQLAKAQAPELPSSFSVFELAGLAPGLLLGALGGAVGGALGGAKSAGEVSSPALSLAKAVLGIVADGLLYDARVYREDPANPGHPLKGVYVFTDKNGAFDLSKLPAGTGKIVAEGVVDFRDASGNLHTTIDQSTGLKFTVTLYAPDGALVINPLTTLVQQLVENAAGAGKTLSVDAANALVAKALGILEPVNLLTFDPIAQGQPGSANAAKAINIQIKAAQIANLLVTGAVAVASVEGGTVSDASKAILTNLVNQIEITNGSIDLSKEFTKDSTQSNAILQSILKNIQSASSQAVDIIAQANDIKASTLQSVYAYQQFVQNDVSEALSTGLLNSQVLGDFNNLLKVIAQGQMVFDVSFTANSDPGADNLINVANPSIRIDLNTLLASKSIAVGNAIQVKIGNSVVYEGVLTAEQINAKEVIKSIANFSSTDVNRLYVTITDTTPVTGKTIASGFMAFHYDANPPDIPTLSPLKAGSESLIQVGGIDTINAQAAAKQLLISGTAEAGTLVTVKLGGKNWVATFDKANPTQWSLTLSPADLKSLNLSGITEVEVVSADKAGNISATLKHPLQLDTVGPVLSANTVTKDHINIAQSNGSLSLEGTVAGSDTNHVSVTVGANAPIDLVLVNGKWALPLSQDLLTSALNGRLEGNLSVTVTASDLSGNTSTVNGPVLYVDLQNPQKPTLSAITGISDQAQDLVINAAEATDGVIISGKTDADCKVTLSIFKDSVSLPVTVSGTSWTATVSKAILDQYQGQVDFKVSSIDPFGNVSSASKTITVATLNPSAPAFTTPITVDKTYLQFNNQHQLIAANSATGHEVINQKAIGSLTLTGSAPANTVLNFKLDGQPLAGDLTQIESTWTMVVSGDSLKSLDQTTLHNLVVTASDAFGNVSSSGALPFFVDTRAPSDGLSGPSSIGGADGVVNAAEAQNLTLTGTAEIGAKVQLEIHTASNANPRVLDVVRTEGSTTWALKVNPAEFISDAMQGGHTLVVVATDPAGNVAKTNPLSFKVDTVAPIAPWLIKPIAGNNVINALEANDSNGVVFSIEQLSDNTTPYLSFINKLDGSVYTVDANTLGASWTVNGTTCKVTLSSSAIAELQKNLASASAKAGHTEAQEKLVLTVVAHSKDDAGNISIDSLPASAQLTIDTFAAQPAVTFNQTGQTINGTNYTSNGQVSVLVEEDASWQYRVNGGAWKPGTGSSFTVSGAESKLIDVRETDSNGNVSAIKTVSFTLDTSVATPVIRLAEDTGSSRTDGVTINGRVLFTNLESATVANTTTYATANWQILNASNKWTSIQSDSNFALSTDGSLLIKTDGSYQLRVNQTDLAGNVSQWVQTNVTVDKVKPQILSINTVSGDWVLSTSEAQQALVITGVTDAPTGQIVTLTIETLVGPLQTLSNPLKIYSGVVSGGTWSVTIPASDVASFSPQYGYQVAASVSDLAGNVKAIEGHQLDLAVTNSGLDGYITGATVFVDNNASGTLDAGEAVSVTDAVGTFSLPATGPLVMQGGLDVSTGLNFQSKYEASAGYRVINPVTTLIREYEKAHPQATVKASTASAVDWIKGAGLLGAGYDKSAGVELGTYDPFRVATAEDNDTAVSSADRMAAISYQKVAAELSNVMDIGAAVLQSLRYPNDSAEAKLTHLQDFSLAVIKQIAALGSNTTDLATALADPGSSGLVFKALNQAGLDAGLTSAQLLKLNEVAYTLAQVNAKIAAVASTGSIDDSTKAVSALANIIRAQGAARSDVIEGKLLDFAVNKVSLQPNSHLIPDALLESTIANTPVGMIVPSRVKVEKVDPASQQQLEGADGDHTPFTITLSRAGNIESVVSLKYAVNLGQGLTADDLVGGANSMNGTVTFAAGQTSVNLTVMILGNDIKAADESFGVVVSDPLGQTQFFDASGQQVSFLARNFTVLNDDPFTPDIAAPESINLGTGWLDASPLHGFSIDYYKPNAALTVKVSTVEGVTFDDSAINAFESRINALKASAPSNQSPVFSHKVETQTINGNPMHVLVLQGNVTDITDALDLMQVKVTNNTTNAFFVVEATDGGPLTNRIEVPVTLHHPVEITQGTLPTYVVAGQLTPLTGFSVNDVDGGVLTVNLNPNNMNLQVLAVPGVTITSLDSGGLRLVGSAGDINDALASLAFTASSADALASATHGTPVELTVSVSDSDPYSSTTLPVKVTAEAVPAPTELSAPLRLVGSAGTPTLVSGLSVSDADSSTVTVSLQATGGTLSLVDSPLLIMRQLSPSSYTLTGAVADVNKTLDQLTFTGVKGATASITVTAQDTAQTTLFHSPSLATKTIGIEVLDRAPPQAGGDLVIRGSGTNLFALVEDQTSLITGLSVSNLRADAGQIPNQIRILSVTGGTLTDAAGNPIATGANGTLLTLVGGQLPNLTFNPDLNHDKDVKISYAVVDTVNQSLLSAPSTFTLTLQAINDAPVLSPSNATFTFTENDVKPVQILSTLKISDVDSTELKSASVSIVNWKAGDVLSIDKTALHAAGLSANIDANGLVSNGTLSLNGVNGASVSLAKFQAVLSTVAFQSDGDNPNTETRIVKLDVKDAGDANAISVYRSISVVAVNDAPTLSSPSALSVDEQTWLELGGKGLQVADADAGDVLMTLTLKVNAGILSVVNGLDNTGYSTDYGIKILSGNQTNLVTLQGSQKQINDFLANSNAVKTTLKYINNNDAPNATDQLTVTVNDNGAAGLGGALSVTQNYPINITAINDKPVLTLGTGSNLSTEALYSASQGSVALATTATLTDVDSTQFSQLKVKILDFKSGDGDVLSLTSTAKQTLVSLGLNPQTDLRFDATKGTLTLLAGAKPISLADMQAIVRGVSYATSDPIPSAGSTRSIVFTTTDVATGNAVNGNLTSLEATVNLSLQATPYAQVSKDEVTAIQTLTLTNDAKAAMVNVDLTTFRITANGANVNLVGGNLFQVSKVDASLSTTAVQVSGNKSANEIIGTGKDDILIGGGGADTLLGGAGKDTFVIGAKSGISELRSQIAPDPTKSTLGVAKLDGGTGIDTIKLVSLQALVDADFVNVSNVERLELAADESVAANQFSYTLTLGAAATTAFGSDSSTGLEVSGAGLLRANLNLDASGYGNAVKVTGTETADKLVGSSQADSIVGGAGNDVIQGGKGADTLTGGSGSNTYVFQAGDSGQTFSTADTITDLHVGDKLDLSAIPNMAQAKVHFESDANGNYLRVEGLGRINLVGEVPGKPAAWSYVGGVLEVQPNHAPVLSLPTSSVVQPIAVSGAGIGYSLNNVLVIDADNDALTVVLKATRGKFVVPTTSLSGIRIVTDQSGVVTVSGDNASSVASAVKALQYNGNTSGPDSIAFSVTDSSNVTTSSVMYVKVPNTPPTITPPATVLQGQALADIPAGQIRVVDPDGADNLTVTVSSTSSALAIKGSLGNATLAKLGEGKLVLKGTAQQVNDALSSLVVKASQTGPSTVSLSVTDNTPGSSAVNSSFSVFANANAPASVSVPGLVGTSGLSRVDVTVSLAGSGAKVGDVVKIYAKEVLVGTAQVTVNDLSNIKVLADLTGVKDLSDGINSGLLKAAVVPTGDLGVSPQLAYSSAVPLVLDLVAPNLSSVSLAPSDDSGRLNDDGITNQIPKLHIAFNNQGAANTNVALGDVITIKDNGATVQTYGVTSADLANGYADVPLGPITGEGLHSFSASVRDIVGNVSVPVRLDLFLDTMPSIEPSLATVETSDLINFTAAYTGVELHGTTDPLNTVNVMVGSSAFSTTANSEGAWFLRLQKSDIERIGEGIKPVAVNSTDAAGNTSSVYSRNITIDTVAPNPPTLLAIAGDSTINIAESHTGVLIGGNAEPASIIQVTIANHTFSTIADSQTGDWSITLSANSSESLFGQGPKPISVTSTDAAGNTSSVRSSTLTVDTIAPQSPMMDGWVRHNDGSVTVTGLAGVNDSLVVEIAGNTYSDVVVNHGAWSVTMPASDVAAVLSTGSISLKVTASDAAFNSSVLNTTFSLVPQAAPTTEVKSVRLSVDSGSSATDFITLETDQTISGTLSAVTLPGELVKVSIDGGQTWLVASNTTGSDVFSLDTKLSGSQTLMIKVQNLTGASANVYSKGYTIDTTPPAITISSEVSDNANTALAKAGDVISVSFTSTDEVTGVTIGGQAAHWVSNGDDVYTATYEVAAGDEDLLVNTDVLVSSKDTAGNTWTAKLEGVVKVDTQAIATIELGKVAQNDELDSTETGLIEIQGAVKGEFSVGDIVTVHIAGLTHTSATKLAPLDAQGKFSVSFDSGLLSSTSVPVITASVEVHDAAGNISTQSDSHSYTINQGYVRLSGKAIDGYISGAKVFYDKDGDGKWDEGEATTVTDNSGHFDLSVDTQDLSEFGRIIVSGGMDTFTGQQLTGDLIALKGQTLVTPLTTLLALATEGVHAVPGLTLAQAQAQFKLVLGIDPSIDLATFDPVEGMMSGDVATQAMSEHLFKAQQAVFSIMQSSSSLATGDSADKILTSSDAVAKAILFVAQDTSMAGTDLTTHLSAITHHAVLDVLEDDPLASAKADLISAAIDSVNEAIISRYTGLADTIAAANTGDLAALTRLAQAKAVAGISQTQLLDLVDTTKAAKTTEEVSSQKPLDVEKAIQAEVDAKPIPIAVDGNNTLQTTLRDLVKNNVVSIDATGITLGPDQQASINIDLGSADGTGSVLSADHMPVISANLGNGEHASGQNLTVTLNLADASQLHDASVSTDALRAAGVDAIQIHLSDAVGSTPGIQDDLDAFLSNPDFQSELSALGSRFDVNQTIEVSGGSTADIHLTQDQAAVLIGADLHFAGGDHITLNVDTVASGTHLKSSL